MLVPQALVVKSGNHRGCALVDASFKGSCLTVAGVLKDFHEARALNLKAFEAECAVYMVHSAKAVAEKDPNDPMGCVLAEVARHTSALRRVRYELQSLAYSCSSTMAGCSTCRRVKQRCDDTVKDL